MEPGPWHWLLVYVGVSTLQRWARWAEGEKSKVLVDDLASRQGLKRGKSKKSVSCGNHTGRQFGGIVIRTGNPS